MKRWFRRRKITDEDYDEKIERHTELPDFDDIYKVDRNRNFGRGVASIVDDEDEDDDDKESSDIIDKKISLVKLGKYKPKKDDHWTIHYIYNLNK